MIVHSQESRPANNGIPAATEDQKIEVSIPRREKLSLYRFNFISFVVVVVVLFFVFVSFFLSRVETEKAEMGKAKIDIHSKSTCVQRTRELISALNS